jgi:PAS domain S-box-containing protein
MAEAVRQGDYVDALQWLNTLASVDLRFTASVDEVLAAWRDRAQRLRSGHGIADTPQTERVTDYRGLFVALLELSYDGIVISDVRDGWMLECSRSFVTLTGYSREELLGRTSLELNLIDPKVREAAVAEARQIPTASNFSTPLRRKDGEIVWVEFAPQLLPGDEMLLTIVREGRPAPSVA